MDFIDEAEVPEPPIMPPTLPPEIAEQRQRALLSAGRALQQNQVSIDSTTRLIQEDHRFQSELAVASQTESHTNEQPSGGEVDPSSSEPIQVAESILPSLRYVDEASPEVLDSYVRILESREDVANLALHLGLDEGVVSEVKTHLFITEHEVPTPNYELGTVEMRKGRFTPDPAIAALWEVGQIDVPPTIGELQELRQLMAHEFVESSLMKSG